MALQQCRLGSIDNALQWDDGDFVSAIETTQTIKAGSPVVANDVVILGAGTPGAVTPVPVTNIDDPSTELNALAGVIGSAIMVYELEAASNQYTIYAFDASDTGGEDVPYTVDASGSGLWVAVAGKYFNNAVSIKGNATITGGVYSSDESDASHFFGHAVVGYIGSGNEAALQHVDLALDGTNYAIQQLNAGTTYVNCVTGKEINFCRNDVTLVTLTQLTSLVDNSMVDTLHRHSELSASDGTPDACILVGATGRLSFNSTARIAWTKITAASITQGAGTHSGTTGDTTGHVEDLDVAFDGDYYHIDEVAAGFDVIIHFTSVTAFNWVQCICNYQGAVSHAVMVQVYNWITTTYDSYRIVPCAIDEFGAGINTQGDSGFFIPDDTNYIGTGGDVGKVDVRILHTSSGNAAHDFDVDCVALYQ